MPVVNPYSTGGLVKDPAMFFGRKEELKRIRERLRKGDCTSVVGLRRVGKSSLLYQLAHQTDELPEGIVAIYLDLQDAVHHQPLGLLNSALKRLNERLNDRYDLPPPKSMSLGAFSTAVKQIAADDFRPALCLDEVEELTDRDAFDDDFFEALRSLGNQRLLAYVTASGESLDVLIEQGGRSSEFYNLFANLDLAGLNDAAARALLTEPFRTAGFSPPPDDHVDYVLELAGRHPFYLQMAAYHLFEARKKGGALNRRALYEDFVREARPHFRNLWKRLSTDEQSGVKKLAGATAAVRDWDRTKPDLIRCGLAEGDAVSPRLFSRVFGEMVKSGGIERKRAPRPRRPRKHQLKGESPTPTIYKYALVALASAVVALFIALLLPRDRFWPFLVALTVVLTFILVLADRLSGEQFLGWLSKLLGKQG